MDPGGFYPDSDTTYEKKTDPDPTLEKKTGPDPTLEKKTGPDPTLEKKTDPDQVLTLERKKRIWIRPPRKTGSDPRKKPGSGFYFIFTYKY